MIMIDTQDIVRDVEMHSLIAKGANINFKDTNGFSLLSMSVLAGHVNAVKILLATEGINIDSSASVGVKAFALSCSTGHLEIAKLLYEAHKKTSTFDVNDMSYGMTALSHACKHSDVEIVKFLLSIPKINTRLKNDEGELALDSAKGEADENEIRALFQGELLSLSTID
jgi:ankyrin repeat protein